MGSEAKALVSCLAALLRGQLLTHLRDCVVDLEVEKDTAHLRGGARWIADTGLRRRPRFADR